MKNNKKAFTLIELLAVIIILAIIALIAVPTVMNIITKARKSAFKDSAYGVIKAGELYFTEKLLDPVGMESDEIFSFPNDIEGLQIKGQLPENGQMKVSREGKVALAISNGTYCARKGYNDEDIVMDENLGNCFLTYQNLVLNGADPVVKTGMIPVNIAPNGVVTKADITSEWYDYANKEWANAVTVKSNSRANYMNAAAGTPIEEDDILTYLVWIPRYRYKLWNVGTTTPSKPTQHSIVITFENKDTTKSNGSTNGTYLTHPAFTFGDEELNGIWVGKFETGYAGAEGASSQLAAEQNVVNSAQVIIKPNTYSWRGITVSNAFNTVQGMNGANNAFGLDATSDTHMMKNMEWGAVAYLSHSVYGKDGEVYINNANTFTTGCGGMAASAGPVSTCDNAYGSKSGNEYNQSTTGNISGVFDMSGGAWEYVMGYTTGASTQYGSSGFTGPIEDKYVDTYSSTTQTDYTNRKLGDATGEMGAFSSNSIGYSIGSWYQDYANFINSSCSWFLRSGFWNSGTVAGVFDFTCSYGNNYDGHSFRVSVA